MANLFKLEAGKYNALMGKLAEAGLSTEEAEAILADKSGNLADVMVCALRDMLNGKLGDDTPNWALSSLARLLVHCGVQNDDPHVTEELFTVDPNPSPVRFLTKMRADSRYTMHGIWTRELDKERRRMANLTEVALLVARGKGEDRGLLHDPVVALGSITTLDGKQMAPQFYYDEIKKCVRIRMTDVSRNASSHLVTSWVVVSKFSISG